MRSATTASRNAKNYAHRNNMEQPLVAEHRGGTNRVRNDRSRNRRTHEVPFIAGCSHFTRKKYKVSCSGFLPNTSPMQHQCNIPFLPLPFVTSLHQGQFFFGDVLLMYCYVVQSLTPPFIKVNFL